MKFVAAIALIIFATGCGYVGRVLATATGSSEVCVDGVKYIQFTSGASVKYDPQGSVVRCP